MKYEKIKRMRVMAASALLGRIEEKKELSTNPIENEASRIFHWTLTQLSNCIESTYPGKGNYSVCIAVINKNLIIGNYYKPTSMLYSFHCKTTPEFDLAIEKVVETFNQIKGYQALFDLEDVSEMKRATLTVSVNLK